MNYLRRLANPLLFLAISLMFGQTLRAQEPNVAAPPQIANPPLRYGLLVDNSGSLRSYLNDVIDTSKNIIEGNMPEDEAFIVRFVSADNIKIVQNVTRNKIALLNALDNMFVEGGESAIIDALYVSAMHLAKVETGEEGKRRRALVIVTDGDDRRSLNTREKLYALLREQQVRVYAIGFLKQLEKDMGKRTAKRAQDFLTKLANETGGRAFFPATPKELSDSTREVIESLHK